MLTVVERPTKANEELRTTLDELLQRGALRMLHEALEAEVDEYIRRHRDVRDDAGRAQVVRNGKEPARYLVTGSGTLEVRAPRIDDRRVDPAGQRHRFTSQILPSYMRKAPNVTEVLPILYLRGLSTGDFQAALPVLLGEEAGGLSPTTITRLTAGWETEYRAWRRRDLHDVGYVYVWVDGVHFRVRLEEDRLCTLVMIGVRADGTKELTAVEESTDSWATVLRDLKRCGMRAPAVAVGDSALGFWAAVGGGVARDAGAALLGASIGERPRQAAEPSAAEGETGASRDHERPHARRGRDRRPGVRGRVRREVSEGRDVAAPRADAAADLLRFSRRALAAPEDDEHHRAAHCHPAAASALDQGRRLTDEGADDGVQTARDGGRALAKGEWNGAAAARACRRALRRRRAGEAEERCWRGEGERRLTHAADPQHLTISPEFGIRLPLGATATRIVIGVAQAGVVLAAIGAVIGGALSMLATQLIESSLFTIHTHDPAT